MATWSMDAAAELRTLLDELETAVHRLGAAEAADWVSPAAKGFRRELDEQRDVVRRLAGQAWEARHAVLVHTNAADAWTRPGGCG